MRESRNAWTAASGEFMPARIDADNVLKITNGNETQRDSVGSERSRQDALKSSPISCDMAH